MSENIKDENIVPQNTPEQPQEKSDGKVIDESNYAIRAPKQKGPSAIGRGGDPLFTSIRATKDQLNELLQETQTVQDWIQREASNNAAIACLKNENLMEGYYQIKDGFDQYGKVSLMGFKTPSGVEIPRLKVFDTNGEVIEVLTGPMAIEEISKRVLAFRSSQYEEVPVEGNEAVIDNVIAEYDGNLS